MVMRSLRSAVCLLDSLTHMMPSHTVLESLAFIMPLRRYSVVNHLHYRMQYGV